MSEDDGENEFFQLRRPTSQSSEGGRAVFPSAAAAAFEQDRLHSAASRGASGDDGGHDPDLNGLTEEDIEAALEELEAELEEKEAVLEETRARQCALAARLGATERRAFRWKDTVAQLEAGIEEAAAEPVPHRAPRRAPPVRQPQQLQQFRQHQLQSAQSAEASLAASQDRPVEPRGPQERPRERPRGPDPSSGVPSVFGATEAPPSLHGGEETRNLEDLLGTWTKARAALGIAATSTGHDDEAEAEEMGQVL